MPPRSTDAAERLADAALELFEERGFRATTVPEIAQRAGLTTRSFFRHYADKREVLFVGDDEIPARVAGLISSQPPGLSLDKLILWGVQTIAREHIEPHREHLKRRRAIIDSDPSLLERELHKQHLLIATLTAALTAQGSDPITATVAAKLTNTLSTTAVDAWLDDPSQRSLAAHLTTVHKALHRVITDPTPLTEAPYR